MKNDPKQEPCGARTRSGAPCRSPKVSGKKRCRMHGRAPGSGGQMGERNSHWRGGRFTYEAIAERRAARGVLQSSRALLAEIEKLLSAAQAEP